MIFLKRKNENLYYAIKRRGEYLKAVKMDKTYYDYVISGDKKIETRRYQLLKREDLNHPFVMI